MDKLLSGRRILVVEDEMLILLMIEDMLADFGCESVTAAATIDQAVALINGQVFDAAMLDMNLDGKDSHAVAKALTACRVPFIFCTGNGGQEMEEGFDGHPVLRKPFKSEELARLITHLFST